MLVLGEVAGLILHARERLPSRVQQVEALPAAAILQDVHDAINEYKEEIILALQRRAPIASLSNIFRMSSMCLRTHSIL